MASWIQMANSYEEYPLLLTIINSSST